MERRSIKTSSVPRLSFMIIAAASEAGCASAGPSTPPDSLDPASLLPTIPPPALIPAEANEPEVVPVDPICVTSGKVERAGASMHVDASGMRAVLPLKQTPRLAELAFVYGGSSSDVEPLANGEQREQIGLKLRAQDSCNLVYVMWRLAPTPGVFVSVKYNPGAATHDECADRGYINLAPSRLELPHVSIGERHQLRADLEGRHLRVFADEELVWEGELPELALSFDGPPGIRSDNVRFDFNLHAGRGAEEPPTGVCPPTD